MREQIEARAAALRKEHESGERLLADLAQRHATLQQTLLRIAGAIQVCEEFLTAPAEDAKDPGNVAD